MRSPSPRPRRVRRALPRSASRQLARLAPGKALAVELNQDHTVGHLRAFIGAQGAGDAPYDLLAGFPPKPLTDAAQTVGAAGLAGGAVSQKLRA